MVKIRLSRTGGKKSPRYRIVVVDSRAKRDGRYIDLLGYYNPLASEEDQVCKIIDEAKLIDWYKKGARLSDTVSDLVRKQGIELV